jgi:hypothetical protein
MRESCLVALLVKAHFVPSRFDNQAHFHCWTSTQALFTIIGSRPKDHVADGYAERARKAAIIARSPDSIPLAPDGVTELDIVRETREAAQPCWFG